VTGADVIDPASHFHDTLAPGPRSPYLKVTPVRHDLREWSHPYGTTFGNSERQGAVTRMTYDDVSPWLIRGIYLFGFAFILTAAIDLGTTVWPMRPGEMAWRYGSLGIAAGYLQTPTLGLLLMAGAAIWSRNVTMLRIVGVLCLAMALVLLFAMGMFALDVLQLRELRSGEAPASTLYRGIFQEVKYFVAMLVVALIGRGALKTAGAAGSNPDWVGSTPGIVSARTQAP
jgi:hypothetical protein